MKKKKTERRMLRYGCAGWLGVTGLDERQYKREFREYSGNSRWWGGGENEVELADGW